MAFALAKQQKEFIDRMVRAGRFNNQSEVVREALRRMAESEMNYLSPPPLTVAQVHRIYGHDPKEDIRERKFGRAAFLALRTAARKGRRP